MAYETIKRRLAAQYPRPQVDPDWLQACCDWIQSEMHLDANSNEFYNQVELQLLQSSLSDSMLQNTGFPNYVHNCNGVSLPRPSQNILVEVVSITDIGNSAFSLQNVRQTRIEKADMVGLVDEEEEDGEDLTVPKYPRSMLKLEVSDGTVVVPAIEFKRLDGLELGKTPLGFKMILKDPLLRRGILFLTPENVILKGHQTEEREALQDYQFLSGLCRRLGKPEPEPPEGAPGPGDEPGHPPAPAPVPAARAASPPRPAPEAVPLFLPDRDASPSPPPAPQQSRPGPSTHPSSSSTLVSSHYFSGPSSSRTRVDDVPGLSQQLRNMLSPTRQDPIIIDDDSLDIDGSVQGPSRSGNPAPNAPSQSQSIGAEPSFDFGDDIFDDAFLAEVEQAEQAAIASQPRAASRVRTPPLPTQNRPSQNRLMRHMTTILLDSDDEKENVPAPSTQRRVRRRLEAQQTVIDISD